MSAADAHSEIKKWLENSAKGKPPAGKVMAFDRKSGKFKVVDTSEPDADSVAEVTAEDLISFGGFADTRHLVIHPQALPDLRQRSAADAAGLLLGAAEVDNGDVAVVDGRAGQDVLISAEPVGGPSGPFNAGRARLVIEVAADGDPASADSYRCYRIGGDGSLAPVGHTLRPGRENLFDRLRGVIETDVLAEQSVAVFGVGSGGSFIARELAKAGVGRFLLVDHDRLEPSNLSRHECGIDDIGRLKVLAMRDMLRQHNPEVEVTALPVKVEGATLATLAQTLQEFGPSVVICATDNRESRLLINRLCILQRHVGIFAGVMRRAYAGQVLRVIPGLTACYQCFLLGLPDLANDQEVSNAADLPGYTDRPVAVEPGLSSDILPVALHVVRLAILEALSGTKTTLDTLREDLVAPLYLWFNRREEGTDAAALAPMCDNVDAMSILRWYGTLINRDPLCPACGDELLAQRG